MNPSNNDHRVAEKASCASLCFRGTSTRQSGRNDKRLGNDALYNIANRIIFNPHKVVCKTLSAGQMQDHVRAELVL